MKISGNPNKFITKIFLAKNRHSKIDKTKILMTNGSLMKVKALQNAPLSFGLHQSIIGLENQFSIYLSVAVLHRFYCYSQQIQKFDYSRACHIQWHFQHFCHVKGKFPTSNDTLRHHICIKVMLLK